MKTSDNYFQNSFSEKRKLFMAKLTNKQLEEKNLESYSTQNKSHSDKTKYHNYTNSTEKMYDENTRMNTKIECDINEEMNKNLENAKFGLKNEEEREKSEKLERIKVEKEKFDKGEKSRNGTFSASYKVKLRNEGSNGNINGKEGNFVLNKIKSAKMQAEYFSDDKIKQVKFEKADEDEEINFRELCDFFQNLK